MRPGGNAHTVAALLLLLAVSMALPQAHADEPAPAAGTSGEPPMQDFALHAEFTYTEQDTNDFRSPYVGANSLSPDRGAETVDVALYAGKRLWPGAELWFNPELDQGFGLDDTNGVAGFPSAEAYKVGKNQPYPRLPRLFIRDTIDLGGERETVDADLLDLAGSRSADRLVFTFGKFSVPDVFDNNQYAHDPRNDFLNWAIVEAGSFDYAADAWAYTVGASAEWYTRAWVLRFGIFDLSNIPNSPDLEPAFHEFQLDGEIERDYRILGEEGKLRITAFLSRGRMGLLDAAIALAESTDTTPNVALVRQYRSRPGIDLNLEQPIAADLGAFLRIGKAAGNVEVYEFTDIDRTVSGGVAMQGTRWSRRDDSAGIAGDFNYISGEREAYLAAGGLGILVGDGRLPHPGPEKILETFYSIGLLHELHLTLDYQHVVNPAYNRDRGPVSLYAVRLHAQF